MRSLAGDEENSGAKRKKAPPPRVRIKALEEGAKVVAPVRPLESRPVEAREPLPPPPLAEGTSVAPAEAPVAPPQASGRTSKPPPPHIQRGGPARAARPETRAQAARAPPAQAAEPSPARVTVAEARAKPAPKPTALPTPATPPSVEPAREHDEAAPQIHTDAGRLSALWAAMALVLLVFLAEVYAGIVSNSLALFSDAGHVFMDLFSYGIAYAAVAISQRRSSQRETFGGHRAEIIAAFVSGLLLMLVVAFIYIEAASRLANPKPVNLTFMLTVPLLSIAANLYLSRRFTGARDLNMRGARMHVLSDLLSGVGVLMGGVLILATGNVVFDPIVSFFIGFLILRGAIVLLRDSAEILLERTPAHVVMDDVMAKIRQTPGVADVHSVHVWSLCSTVHALSAHVVAASRGPEETQRLLGAVRAVVEKDFGIHFTTIQVEGVDCGADQHPTVVHGLADALSHAHSHG